MFRKKSIFYLLIALVFQCPYQCYFAGCRGFQSSEEVCGCCSHDKSDDVDSHSNPLLPEPSDQCPCGDCFCKGAITIVPTNMTAEVNDSAIAPWDFLAAAIPKCISAQPGQLSANTFFLPLIASGHRVRAALSSWQI